MSVLIIGTVAFDTIETPTSQGHRLLGGSATYASMAAALFSSVGVVSIVGHDFNQYAAFHTRNIDTTGIAVGDGDTFHWSGYYTGDMAQAMTRQTDLNVLVDFNPQVPDAWRSAKTVFCANVDPELQKKAIQQVQSPSCVVLDTMNFWIEHKREALLDVLPLVDLVVLNDQELMQLTGASSIMAALPIALSYGPRHIIVKKGEHGALFYDGTQFCVVPAVPIMTAVDPTGAGDTFAGGLVGILDQLDTVDLDGIRRAMVHGTLLASNTVQGLGTQGLADVTSAQLKTEYQTYHRYAGLGTDLV